MIHECRFANSIYVKRLADAQTRLELVEASLSLSYNLLSEDLQQAWCALAVFPDTFDLSAATAVWAVEKNLAEDRLDELVHCSLVDWNETDARARLHDLARLFANKRLGDAARLDSQRRHATHYQKVSATANSLYHQGGERLIQQGLALFDLEWTNIQTGHAWAARYADKDTQALSLCDDYPGECFRILNVRQHPRERIAWLDTALIAARKLARRRAEGWHLSNLGIAYHTLGEYRRAIEYQEQHLTVAREIGDRGGEGSALGNLGAAYDALGETRRAIEYHEQHLTIAHEIDNRGHEGMALGNLGAAYHALGEYRRAIEYYEQALTIRRELGDWRDESVDLGNLGTAYAALGAARRAIEYYEQQRAIAEKIGDRSGEASSLWGLAICCYAANERPQAIAHAQAALDIFTTIESPSAQTMRDLLAQWQQAEQ